MSKIERALERAQHKQASSGTGRKSSEKGNKLSILERATETAAQQEQHEGFAEKPRARATGVGGATGATGTMAAPAGAPVETVAPAPVPPVSASVPAAAGGNGSGPVRTDGASAEIAEDFGKAVVPPALSNKVAAAQGLYSPASEEYRKLKEQVVKITNQTGFQNMLMVTSSTVGEGKSITAVNLAVSLAQEFDHTVLLIDADMRRPTCHTYFGYESTPGLAECLLDDKPFGDAIIPTGIGRLSFMPAGRALSNPGELFNSSIMKDFLLEVKHRYPDRYIIIDTAPVLPFAETRVLSRIVDGTIIVVREGVVAIRDVKETFKALEGANLLGLVYNGSTKATAPSGYYAYAYAYRR